MTDEERERFHLQFTIDPADRIPTEKVSRPFFINMAQPVKKLSKVPKALIKLPFKLIKKD